MKVAYISGTGFADTDFSIIREMRRKVDLHYFLIITPHSLKSTAVNIQKQYHVSGIFKPNIYPEVVIFSEFFDMEKTYIVNICSYRTDFKSSFVFMKLLFLLKRMNIDVLHLTNYNIQHFLLYILHKKICLTVHDPIPHSGIRSAGKDFIFRKIAFHFFKNFVIFNKRQKDEFISLYKLKHKNIHVSRFGICVYLLRYTDDRLPNNEKYILFFGRITSYKGLDFLFPAMKIVNETHKEVKLIAAGYCKNYYFDISDYRDCSYIEIINRFIPDNELAVLIQNALFVVCPYTDATQSGVVMSSFAFNVPVLATNVGGLSEYVEHMKSGYIVPPKDVKELANGIIYLLCHKELLNEQRKYIDEKYKSGEYSWNKITDDFIEFYKAFIQNKKEI